MKKLLLDIDGVLANFYHGLAKFLNEKYNAGLDLKEPPFDYNVHNWGHELPKPIVDKSIPHWITSGGYRDMPVYEGAADFTNELMRDFDVYVVTARAGDFAGDAADAVNELVVRDTYNWLDQLGVPTNKLFFKDKKVDFCKENGIEIVVEDKLPTVAEAVQNGLRCFLVEQNWNAGIYTGECDGVKDDHPLVDVVDEYDKILRELKND